jgi:hypothetical protein
MKIEKFQLRGNNLVRAGAFQLLRGRAPTQLRVNIVPHPPNSKDWILETAREASQP